ncbi:MAG: NAD-dependent succinate-semialdehyde dehydrogenase, partial [Gemmatimonadaceae bacterium]|nr:NAD-dependent succinate-semialdehyde dehydrogenase [Gemmatimonadaceae bacterium]
MPIQSINPVNNELVKSFTEMTPSEVDRRLSLGHSAFLRHRSDPIDERARSMRRAADILVKRKNDLARLMTMEMGKPLSAAVAEAEKSATACVYYAENAARFLADQKVKVEDGEAWIAFQPIGIVLAVMPWNFPFWQVFRFAAPSLMAGNAGILKHASNVPQCALAIESVFREAGFAEGLFQTLLLPASGVDALIADTRIAAVTLTGSDGAGRAVAAAAGKNLKKCVVELGGSDPFVVMPSADVSLAAETAVTARMINNGQSCIAAKRFIIHESVHAEFLEKFVDGVNRLKVGDPLDSSVQVGPLATRQGVDNLEKQVDATVAAGAKVLVGGKRIPGTGNFFQPTVLTDVHESTPGYTDELFGPVASVFKARDIDDAIRIANSTRFGLGASVWTNDASEREKFVGQVESGLLFINGMVASDARLPFGGVKDSGFGRELGEFGIHEFVNVKTVR